MSPCIRLTQMIMTSGPSGIEPDNRAEARASDPSLPALLVGESSATTRGRSAASLNCLRRGSIESAKDTTGNFAAAVAAADIAATAPINRVVRKVRFMRLSCIVLRDAIGG